MRDQGSAGGQSERSPQATTYRQQHLPQPLRPECRANRWCSLLAATVAVAAVCALLLTPCPLWPARPDIDLTCISACSPLERAAIHHQTTTTTTPRPFALTTTTAAAPRRRPPAPARNGLASWRLPGVAARPGRRPGRCRVSV